MELKKMGIVGLGIALLTGLITNAIFFLIIRQLRPRLEISPKIAKCEAKFDSENRFQFKIINYTRAPLVDVEAELLLVKKSQSKDGVLRSTKHLQILSNNVTWIQRYSKSDTETSYAYRFNTDIDLLSKWEEDECYLIFRIFARHGYSNIAKIFERKFIERDKCIIDGNFEIGEGLQIKEN